jgi:hypothetical protein
VLNRRQIYACRWWDLSFVSGFELEGLWDKVAAEDGWWSAIQGCKEDKKNRRLDEDKKGDSKEEEAGYQAEESEVFLVRRRSLQDR